MKKLSELFSLKGKTALITGGGRGIGKFIATGLAEAGADLIVTSRKMKNLEATAEEISATYGVQVLPVACDVARAEDIESMVKTATENSPGSTSWSTTPGPPGVRLHWNFPWTGGTTFSTSTCAVSGY